MSGSRKVRGTSKGPVPFARVFEDELQELELRRELARRDASPFREKTRRQVGPSAQLGLTGLSLSGGGIRSATFSLGVLQALGAQRIQGFDYLSTVSGGGFVGAALTSASNRTQTFPFSKPRAPDSPVVRHLRNNSSYLNPGRLLDGIRLPALVVRGVFLNLLVILPWLLVAAMLTRAFYTVVYNQDLFHYVEEIPLILALPFAIALACHPLSSRWKRRSEGAMERYERVFAGSLVLAVAGVSTCLALHVLVWAIEHQEAARKSILDMAGVWGASVGILLLFYGGLTGLKSRLGRLARRLALGFIGAVVPVSLAGAYVFFTIDIIPPPMVQDREHSKTLEAATRATSTGGVELSDGSLLEWLRAQNLQWSPATLRGCRDGEGPEPEDGVLPGSCWVVEDAARKEHEVLVRWRDPTNHDADTYLAFDRIPTASLLTLVPERRAHSGVLWLTILVMSLSASFVYLIAMDANALSLHGFYRDCLARVFVTGSSEKAPRGLLLSQLETSEVEVRAPSGARARESAAEGGERWIAPYPLVNATLNLRGATDTTLRDRKGTAFVFSPRHVGSEATGYVATRAMEKATPGFTLASAVAVSAAAAGPNMGSFTSNWLAPLFTLLNLRLGYWLPHPKLVGGSSGRVKTPGPWQVLREALGQVNERGKFVNVSDGGHFENSGAYELVRRRARLIVLVDGEQDVRGRLGGLTTLMRLVRIDFGATIEADVGAFRERLARGEGPPWLWATIHYQTSPDGRAETGDLLYVKAAVTGGEPEYVRTYRADCPEFPHESTADQFFNEVQFECYRALGEHVAQGLVNEGSLDRILGEEVAPACGVPRAAESTSAAG